MYSIAISHGDSHSSVTRLARFARSPPNAFSTAIDDNVPAGPAKKVSGCINHAPVLGQVSLFLRAAPNSRLNFLHQAPEHAHSVLLAVLLETGNGHAVVLDCTERNEVQFE